MTIRELIVNNYCFIQGFPDSSVGKEFTHNAGDLGSIPRLGRSPGDGKATHSSLENSMDCVVHGGHKESDTTERLSLSHFHCFIQSKNVIEGMLL